MMGTPSEAVAAAFQMDESPQHLVTISLPFAVGRFEVTWSEWDACVRADGCDSGGPERMGGDNGWGRDRRPVINVSWDDAKAYVRWLSEETGQPYRLLTESEWEYAARGGTTTAYWWGDQPSHAYANYGEDPCCEGLASGRDRWVNTAPVGSFPPNPFGLYDMHGNVREWVEDCYRSSYSGARADGSAEWANGRCFRVLRNASWGDSQSQLRSAERDRGRMRPAESGFRVARTLVPSADKTDAAMAAMTDALPSPARSAALSGPIETIRDRLRTGREGPEMIVVPGGRFVMGSAGPRRRGDEGPRRVVGIGSFAVGRFEVTFKEWDACMRDGGCQPHDLEGRRGRRRNDERSRGRHPVVRVSWEDAQDYVRWLSRQSGERYRLLTEAEWEYAARAGTTGEFNNNGGDAELCEIANVSDASFGASALNLACTDGVSEGTAPVGSYAPNAFGLHDMHGNVREWVEDCYRDSYLDAPTDGSAVVYPGCRWGVIRGGSWLSLPERARSAAREYFSGHYQYSDSVGFRVARDL